MLQWRKKILGNQNSLPTQRLRIYQLLFPENRDLLELGEEQKDHVSYTWFQCYILSFTIFFTKTFSKFLSKKVKGFHKQTQWIKMFILSLIQITYLIMIIWNEQSTTIYRKKLKIFSTCEITNQYSIQVFH